MAVLFVLPPPQRSIGLFDVLLLNDLTTAHYIKHQISHLRLHCSKEIRRIKVILESAEKMSSFREPAVKKKRLIRGRQFKSLGVPESDAPVDSSSGVPYAAVAKGYLIFLFPPFAQCAKSLSFASDCTKTTVQASSSKTTPPRRVS